MALNGGGDGDEQGLVQHQLRVKEEHTETVYILESDLAAQMAGQISGADGMVTTVVIAPASVDSGANCTVTTVLETTQDQLNHDNGGGGDYGEQPGSSSSLDPYDSSSGMEGALSPGGGKMKRRISGKEEKLMCQVCGDKALGCNFDAVSCESCKAFFRRNALKNKMAKCLFDGHCSIDVNTRRFCPHCRLQKCFKVGMKKHFILGDNEKKKRMEKVLQNRSKKVKREDETPSQSGDYVDTSLPNSPSFSQPDTPTPLNYSNPATPVTPSVTHMPSASPPSTITITTGASVCSTPVTSTIQSHIPAFSAANFSMGQTVGEVMTNAIALSVATMPPDSIATTNPLGGLGAMSSLMNQQSLRTLAQTPTSSANQTFTLPPTLLSSLAGTIDTSTIAEAVQQAIQLQLQTQTQSMDISNLICLSRLIKPTDMYTNTTDEFLVRHLTQDETNMLNDLMQIYHLSFTADLEPLIHLKQIDPSLDQLVNQSSITVLRIIKFAKRLEEFVKLSQECQIGILKGCWIHILLLRSVSVYDIVRDVWGTPRGDIPTAILKNATGYDQLHDDHINYCKSIKAIIRDDITIVVILIVIVLFSPEGPHVMTRELVSNIQDRYLVLLKHYLESKYTYLRAGDMFPQLISKMKELKELAEVHGRVLLDVNPSEIEPIMLEILDLK